VPQFGLDALAVGLDRFEPALDAELDKLAVGGHGAFKAVRGEYGSGKTFFVVGCRSARVQRGSSPARC